MSLEIHSGICLQLTVAYKHKVTPAASFFPPTQFSVRMETIECNAMYYKSDRNDATFLMQRQLIKAFMLFSIFA